jgi:hypothetical protein
MYHNDLMGLRFGWAAVWFALAASGLRAQVIQFESGGLRYQTLSRKGVTVMFAPLPVQLREYSILQVGVMNGSSEVCVVRPEDFSFRQEGGTELHATPARTVVGRLLQHAGRSDVIKLITTYEMSINGVAQFRSTNGYEQRRQAALAEMGSAKLKAASAAAAIAFVAIKLAPGESTDGALFFVTSGKPLGPGWLMARAGGEVFEFESDPSSGGKVLQRRTEPPPPE